MKNYLTPFLLFALSGKMIAQCNPAIPSNAVVISTTQTTGFGGSQVWVCSGVTETSNGGSNTFFLEVGATIMAGGGSNTIYCPAGATVNVSSGSNIIYYVNPGDLVNPGGGPTLNQCASIVYDYTNAPNPGCSPTTGIVPLNSVQLISVFPNPCSGTVTVSAALADRADLNIYNSLGEEVLSLTMGSADVMLDVSAFPKGIYFIRIVSGVAVLTQRLIIQ